MKSSTYILITKWKIWAYSKVSAWRVDLLFSYKHWYDDVQQCYLFLGKLIFLYNHFHETTSWPMSSGWIDLNSSFCTQSFVTNAKPNYVIIFHYLVMLFVWIMCYHKICHTVKIISIWMFTKNFKICKK